MILSELLEAIDKATTINKEILEAGKIKRSNKPQDTPSINLPINKVEKIEHNEMKTLEEERYREQNQGIHDTNEMRRKLAYRIFWVVAGTLIFDGAFILLHGIFQAIWDRPLYSDSVIIALLTSTTASVIGLVAIVLHNLFPNKNGKS